MRKIVILDLIRVIFKVYIGIHLEQQEQVKILTLKLLIQK